MTRHELQAVRALDVLAATAHDAAFALRKAGVVDGQLDIVKTIVALAEAARDHPAVADLGPHGIGRELLAYFLGHAATAERA
jgi:hypothetical protein